MRKELGSDIGEAVQDQPATEEAAAPCEQLALQPGAAHDGLGQRVGEEVQGRNQWWCVREPAWLPSGSWRGLRSQVACRTSSGQRTLRGSAACDRVDPVEAAARRCCCREQACPVEGRGWRSSPPCPSRARRSTSAAERWASLSSSPVKGSSGSGSRASSNRARAIAARWRWPPRGGRRLMREAGEVEPARAPRARRFVSRVGRRHQGRSGSVPIRSDVECADRVVEPRAVGLRHGRGAPRDLDHAGERASWPSSTLNRVVWPPPLGPSTESRSPRRASKLRGAEPEPDCPATRSSTRAAGRWKRQDRRRSSGAVIRFPPPAAAPRQVKPRIIASAFACSISR